MRTSMQKTEKKWHPPCPSMLHSHPESKIQKQLDDNLNFEINLNFEKRNNKIRTRYLIIGASQVLTTLVAISSPSLTQY
jgi:hypothetical protein